jgi:hypothetical protein
MDRHVQFKSQVSDNQLTTLELLRNKIKVNEEGIENIIFKIAETKTELESAFHLTYQIYVQNGYMNPCSTGLRFNFFNAMPYTQTFIAKANDQTIMTTSLFPDSPLGLPADCMFQKKINEYRQQGKYLAEIGANVSTINNQKAVMHLMKIMHTYARDYLKVDDIVITVPPKHKNFYVYVLGFELFGEQTEYAYVNGNPAVALKLDLHENKNIYWNNYPREPLENDLHHFFFKKESQLIILPEKKAPLKVWDDQLFDYFFKERTNLYAEANNKTRSLIQKYYHEYALA